MDRLAVAVTGEFPQFKKSGQSGHFSCGKFCRLIASCQIGDLVPSRRIGETGASDKLSFAERWGYSPPVGLANSATPVASPTWQSYECSSPIWRSDFKWTNCPLASLQILRPRRGQTVRHVVANLSVTSSPIWELLDLLRFAAVVFADLCEITGPLDWITKPSLRHDHVRLAQERIFIEKFDKFQVGL